MNFAVEAGVPYGNVCDFSITQNAGMIEVGFAADPHGGPECLWFCFRLARKASSGFSGSQVKLVLKHPDNLLGGNRLLNIRPAVRRAGEDWHRLAAGMVEELPDGRRTLAWMVDAPDSFFDVAFCYPYGAPEIEALRRDTGGFWRADTVGVSQGGRPLVRLSNDYGSVASERPGLYLIARQHSGETPGSWVLDGFLRHLASLGEDAPLVWTVPLAHIDGVERGDYGKDGFPYDLNRAWGTPPMRHETLVVQRDINRWRERCRPVLALDFHAPGACESSGMFCYVSDPQKHPERHGRQVQWTAAMKRALGPRYAAENFERVADYPSRWDTPNFTAAWGARGLCTLTIETPYALVGELILTRKHYREAGARLAQGIVEGLDRSES